MIEIGIEKPRGEPDPRCSFQGDTTAVVDAKILMSFRGRNVAELKKSFRDVVDTYLVDCKAAGRRPEKPYNGTIVLRVDPEIHRRVAMKAATQRKSMNKYVESLLEKAT